MNTVIKVFIYPLYRRNVKNKPKIRDIINKISTGIYKLKIRFNTVSTENVAKGFPLRILDICLSHNDISLNSNHSNAVFYKGVFNK